jgi:predicted ester cyclase
MLEENKAVVRRFIEEVLNQRKTELLDELLTPDHVLYHPALPKTVHGLEGTRVATANVLDSFSAVTFTIVEMVAEKDKVAVRFTVAGTHPKGFMGFKEDKHIKGTGITVYRVRDGKLASATIQEDILSMLHSTGMVPRNNTMLYWMNRVGIVRLLQKLGKIPEGAPLEDAAA